MRKALLYVLIVCLFAFCVSAADELYQETTRLNYYDSETHTVTIANSGSDSSLVNISMPVDWNFTLGANCDNLTAILIQCNISAGGSASYTIVSPGSTDPEYNTTTFSMVSNNTYTGNDVDFIRIRSDEIFHTLVEFGRGRGNYFFDSYGGGQYAGSGHSGTGCPYVPNGTLFELNFLHKVNNIKHYFGSLTDFAYNATFQCSYPNATVVREHLINNIITNTSGTYLNYEIPRIEGSWERMGFLGMDFKAGDYGVGSDIVINCTNITYRFPFAGGYFYIPEDSFTLEVRDRYPFIASASAFGLIGNGTQEMLITYNITNNESYTLDNVIFEIQAPPYAQFIGLRGELWGVGEDQHRIEKLNLLPGESEVITLAARFNTSEAPDLSSLDYTNGIKSKYTTCWEINAYNPTEYTQTITGLGGISLNMSLKSNITSVITRIIQIKNLTTRINRTVININDTVNHIQVVIDVINETTQDTNIIVKQINSTSHQILNKSEIIFNNTNLILNDTSYIYDLLNCNGTVDSPICDKVQNINLSFEALLNFTLDINYTAAHLNITVIENFNFSGLNLTIDIDLSNITALLDDLEFTLNCTNTTDMADTSVCKRLERVENNTIVINNTLNDIWNLTVYFNNTVFEDFTLEIIWNALTNLSADIETIYDEVEETQAFNEEVVFLITDSFNLQGQTRQEFLEGDIVAAANDLTKSQQRLETAMQRLTEEESSLVAGSTVKAGYGWFTKLLFGLVLAAFVVYLLGKPPKERRGSLQMRLVFCLIFVFAVALVAASHAPSATILQEAENLNFGEGQNNVTIDVHYNCSGIRYFNVTFPSGWTLYETGGVCALINTTKTQCTFQPSFPFNEGSYKVRSPADITDYANIEFPSYLSNYTDCNVANNITVVNVPDSEIFHTLVEYGRGRGNYFYDTIASGVAGSGHTGVGCPYVPNGTLFELSFLHKILNIKQYYDDADLIGENATWQCTYPKSTIVRSHNGEDIGINANYVNISYHVDEIEGSWERMGYVSLQFDDGQYSVGQNLTIECGNVTYLLSGAGGSVSVFTGGSSFQLEVRDPTPFTVTALPVGSGVVGNGTQEVLIRYNITNTEVYRADDVIIEIQAPRYSEFIGARGELWGVGEDQHRIEKMYLDPGESEVIELVARFNTSDASGLTSLNLADSVKLKYITCWDINAYNPAATTQTIVNVGNISVNMSIPTNVINIREEIEKIFELVTIVNETTLIINDTVTTIDELVLIINSTTFETNIIVQEINNTLNYVLSNVTVILDTTYDVLNDTADIKELIDCDGNADTPICAQLDDINASFYRVWDILVDVNESLHNVSVDVTINLGEQNISVNVTTDITNITIRLGDIIADLNCTNVTGEPETSVCKRLERIENNTIFINNTANEINDIILHFNSTVFGNFTFRLIYDKIQNLTIRARTIINRVRLLRQFSEELVFLVTDSFGLQQQALVDVANGEVGKAAEKLGLANTQLIRATDELLEAEKRLAMEETRRPWLWPSILAVALIIGALLFLARKPRK